MSCTFERGGCTVDYQVVLSGPFNTMGSVFVGEERGEPINSPGSMIVVDVVLLVCYHHILQTVRSQTLWMIWPGLFQCQL